MMSYAEFLKFVFFGPNVTKEINVLQALSSTPALTHLINTLSSIEIGDRKQISEKEIKDGLENLKKHLDVMTDSRNDLNDGQKEYDKIKNLFVINGCYDNIVNWLKSLGYIEISSSVDNIE